VVKDFFENSTWVFEEVAAVLFNKSKKQKAEGGRLKAECERQNEKCKKVGSQPAPAPYPAFTFRNVLLLEKFSGIQRLQNLTLARQLIQLL
jgi:hypothetical protein